MIKGKIIEGFSAPVHIHWIDIALFPQHVGFLTLKAEIRQPDLSVDHLNDFLYYARQIHPAAVGWQLPVWRRTDPQAPLTFEARDLVDFLLQGLTDGADPLAPTLESFLERLPPSIRLRLVLFTPKSMRVLGTRRWV